MSKAQRKPRCTRPGRGGAQYLYPKKHIPVGNSGLEDNRKDEIAIKTHI